MKWWIGEPSSSISGVPVQVGSWSTMRCAESGFGVMTRVGTWSFRQTAAMSRGFAGSGHTVGTLARGFDRELPMASNSDVPIRRSVSVARNGCGDCGMQYVETRQNPQLGCGCSD